MMNSNGTVKMKDSYEIIKPPFTLHLQEMNKREIGEYCTWYIEQIPVRIVILQQTVNHSHDYRDWEANYSPESLDSLGEWFVAQIESRDLDEGEIKDTLSNAPKWFSQIEYPKQKLTNRTFSIAFDVGMYISQVFIRNARSIKWKCMKTVSKNNIHYGQPVLEGFDGPKGNKGLYFNPSYMIIVLANGIRFNEKTGKHLKILYDKWIEYI
jgi:hypothetical protein